MEGRTMKEDGRKVIEYLKQMITKRWMMAIWIGMVVILISSAVSSAIYTNFGHVKVTPVEFICDNGLKLAGNMYVPDTASAENPSPAIYVQHGGNVSRESMFAYAVEYSRRGYVVFNAESFGNGYSEPNTIDDIPASVHAMKYLMGLDFVDTSRVGAVGHSAGAGQAVKTGIYNDNELGVRSIAVLGAGANGATVDSTFNLAYIVGYHDQNHPGAKEILSNPDNMALFGTSEPIVEGQWYGSVENNTGRIMWNPEWVFHIMTMHSGKVITLTLDFFEETLGHVSGIPSTDHVFVFRLIADLVAMVGLMSVMFGMLFGLTSSIKYKNNFVSAVSEARLVLNKRFYITFSTIIVLIVLLTQRLYVAGFDIMPKISSKLQLTMVNANIFYIVVTSLMMLLANIYLKKKSADFDFKEDSKVWKVPVSHALVNIGIAFVIFLTMHEIAAFVQNAFDFTHFHFFGFKPEFFVLNWERWKVFFIYFGLFFISQLLVNYVEASSYRMKGGTNKSFAIICVLVNTLAPLLYVVIMIGYKAFGWNIGSSPVHDLLLLTNPLMRYTSTVLGGAVIAPILAYITVYSYDRSKSIWLGSTLNACLLTWIACGAVLSEAVR